MSTKKAFILILESDEKSDGVRAGKFGDGDERLVNIGNDLVRKTFIVIFRWDA